MKRTDLLSKLAASVALIFAPATLADAQSAPSDSNSAGKSEAIKEQAVELSPFVVTGDSDVGYVATSSLAGSRLNTPLRDTAASISVLTEEFLSDVGATNLSEALEWANNVQQEHVDTLENDNNYIQGFASFRVRGISADITRNYFPWRLSTDSYNVGRVEEQRGPNSILFGIGSAGGILNQSTKQASGARNFRRATGQVGSFGSYRGTMDVNQRGLDGRFAVRVNAVYSNKGHWRRHSFDDTRRLHLASTFRLTPKTTLRGEYEVGELSQANARTMQVLDSVTNWWNAGRPTVAAAVTGTNLAALGLSNYGTARRVTYINNTNQAYDMVNRNTSTGVLRNAFSDESIAHRSVNTGGPSQRRDGDFKTWSFYLEHQFAKKTFAELAYNHLEDRFTSYIAGQGRDESSRLKADPHLTLPNGQPNPYAGQLFFEGDRWNRRLASQRRDNTRLTLSHDHDLGKWGSYRLAALGEYEWRNEKNRVEAEAWAGRPFNVTAAEQATNIVYRRSYITEGDWASYYLGGPRELGLIPATQVTVAGATRTLSSTWVSFNQNESDDPEYQKTLLLGGQARYFDGRVVLGMGYRRDSLKRTERGTRRNEVQEWTLYYDENEDFSYSSNTKTVGLVVHPAKFLSFFYNMSNSFSLPGTARILPDSKTGGNPEADGQDFGVALTFRDGRLNLRANAFKTKLIGGQDFRFGGTANNPTVLARNVYNSAVAAGLMTQAQMDARMPDSTGATFDRVVEGYETTITANITKGWRLQANYSFTDGYEANVGPEVKRWAAEMIPAFRQFENVRSQANPEELLKAVIDRWEEEAKDLWALEGLSIRGNRRHKVNIFTRYSFSTGPLKGLNVGGGYRHMSKSELTAGDNIFHGNSYWIADAMVGYQLRRFPWLKKGVGFQLNVANVFDWSDPIVTRFADSGNISRWRYLDPRTFRLTANVEF